MNALTIGSLIALLAIIGIGGYWLYGRGRFEGASQQKAEDEEIINEWLKENAPDIYDGRIGINAFRVSSEDAWGKDTGARVEIRLVSKSRTHGERDKGDDSG